MPRYLCCLLLLAIMALPARADMTGREIMVRVDAVDSSLDATQTSTMTIRRGSMTLVRRMERVSKKYGENNEDKRSLVRFQEPADVHGTTYLTWSYDDPEREDDMWIFLPAESLVRRISGGGKKGSFMRSDLANEDIEDRAVDDDTHTLLGSEDKFGASCWIVESVPRPGLKRDTNYSKRIVYVRKDTFLPQFVEYYDRHGDLLKTATHGGFKQIDGIWTITKSLYETPARGTKTTFEHTDIRYNTGLDDSLFLQSALKR